MSVCFQVCRCLSLSVCAEYSAGVLQYMCISSSTVTECFVICVSVASLSIQNSSETCVYFLVGVHAVQFSLYTFLIVFASSVVCVYISFLVCVNPETSLFCALYWCAHEGVHVWKCAYFVDCVQGFFCES